MAPGEAEEEKKEIVDPLPEEEASAELDSEEVGEPDAVEPVEQSPVENDEELGKSVAVQAVAVAADPPGEHVDEKPKPLAFTSSHQSQPEAHVDIDDEDASNKQSPPWYRNKNVQIAGIALIVSVIVVVLAVVLRVVLNDDNEDDNDSASSTDQQSSSQWIARDRGTENLEGTSAEDFFGWSLALSAQGNILAVGAPQDKSQNQAGYVRVWEWAVSEEDASDSNLPSWIARGFPISSGLTGYSVALNGDGSILAVGEVDTTDNSAKVCIREWNLINWQQRGPCISNPQRQFGQALALSKDGSVIAIGSTESTLVEVWSYVESNFTWNQVGESINGDESFEHGGGHSGMDGVGTAMDMNADGTVVAVGGNDKVSVWQLTTTTSEDAQEGNSTASNSNSTNIWELKGEPVGTPAPGVSDWQTGGSVSLSADGNTMAVGVSGHDGNGPDSGHVQVWEWSATSWIEKGNEIRGEDDFDYFGFSVAMSADGNTIIAGAPGHDGIAPDSGRAQQNSGNSRVFEWSGDEWVVKGERIMGDSFEGDASGRAVAIADDGSVVAVGAPFHATNGNGMAGIVRVYEIEEENDS